MSEMLTPSEAMNKEALKWLEVVVSLHDGSQRLERELMAAEMAEDVDPARMMTLAYAALTVAGAGEGGTFAPWYRDKAMSLLRRAMDGLAMAEAGSSDRPAVLN